MLKKAPLHRNPVTRRREWDLQVRAARVEIEEGIIDFHVRAEE